MAARQQHRLEEPAIQPCPYCIVTYSDVPGSIGHTQQARLEGGTCSTSRSPLATITFCFQQLIHHSAA